MGLGKVQERALIWRAACRSGTWLEPEW